jgi:hypothetical protein
MIADDSLAALTAVQQPDGSDVAMYVHARTLSLQ